jgi:hypothetical protein
MVVHCLDPAAVPQRRAGNALHTTTRSYDQRAAGHHRRAVGDDPPALSRTAIDRDTAPEPFSGVRGWAHRLRPPTTVSASVLPPSATVLRSGPGLAFSARWGLG